ncbi:hypothetical protein [Bauldia sp.]|uniref:hypothetical protein n=1 Tax=Bauldia sp. TaxID=2575872 RepID=UPI003BA9864E
MTARTVTLGAALLVAGAAFADEPDLTGTWEAVSGSIRTTSGETMVMKETSHVEFIFTDQVGPVFSGTYGWVHPETMQDMHDGEKVTHEALETIVGVIHHDGRTITISDHPDTGIFIGEIVDDNRIELITFESGPHALAGRMTLERQ